MIRSKLFGRKITVTKETARTAQKKAYYSSAKLLKFLPGFTYTQMPETLRRMSEAYKRHRQEKI